MRIYFPVQPVIPLTLSEKCRLRAFENKVLMKIFGPKREEMMEVWRRLHSEELYDLYSTPNIIRVIKRRKM
jgi:hypothetical protein